MAHDDARSRPVAGVDRIGPPSKLILTGVVLCGVLVLGSILLLDRPAATFAHDTFHGAEVFRDLTHIVDPILPLAALGLIAAAAAGAGGWRPGPVGRTLIACCLAALVAVAIKDQLKFAFGRLWPETWIQNNPSWIKDGAFGFAPFHGGTGWSSFPSGHMTEITAPIAVLWQRLPRWRACLAAPVMLVAVGLYGADFHFIGDMIAGTYLGAACAAGVLAVLAADERHPEALGTEDRDGARHRHGRSPDAPGMGVPSLPP